MKITNAMYMISSSKLKKSEEGSGEYGTVFLYFTGFSGTTVTTSS